MLRSTVALTMKTMTTSKDSEKFIERYLCSEVESRGGLALKYSNQGAMGYPDRLCLLPGGRVFWVEVKSKGRKPDILQRIRILIRTRRMLSAGSSGISVVRSSWTWDWARPSLR